MKTVLVVIPARKNSKRIPNKNKKIFLGKPLVFWTIDNVIKSTFVSKIVVTTDDDEIISYQDKYPSVQFYRRPSELALDDTPGVDPVIDVMLQQNENYDYVMLLQPTSPLRTLQSIDQAITEMIDLSCDTLVSVKPLIINPNHVLAVDRLGKSRLLSDCNEICLLNGAIYISKWSVFMMQKSFLTESTYLFRMSEKESVDIDTESDWLMAESLFLNKIK